MISLPWCHHPDQDEWFLNWKHRKPNEHLHHFNQRSLCAFMYDQGWSCVNHSNLEDGIRQHEHDWENILTAVFKKI
jgi:hypothetical protein